MTTASSPPIADPRLPSQPDTLTVFSDLNCSFAHLAIYRLHRARSRLGLDGRLWFDHRAFPLELFNNTVNERPGIDSEVTAVGALEPDAGWRLWQGPDWTYPVTTLLPLEAVQAAKAQSWHASEQLDIGLRRAFWAQGRCIAQRHVILTIAAERGLDTTPLAHALGTGASRSTMIGDFRTARDYRVRCSPHIYLTDGTNQANPGIRVRWQNGAFGAGFPIIEADNPNIYDDLLSYAADLVNTSA